MPDKEKIVTGIHDTVPIDLREAYRSAAEKCFDELALGNPIFGNTKLLFLSNFIFKSAEATKPTDESCSSYEPLPTCLLKAYASVSANNIHILWCFTNQTRNILYTYFQNRFAGNINQRLQ